MANLAECKYKVRAPERRAGGEKKAYKPHCGHSAGAPDLKTLARHASLRVSVLDTVRVLRVADRYSKYSHRIENGAAAAPHESAVEPGSFERAGGLCPQCVVLYYVELPQSMTVDNVERHSEE